MAIHRVAHGLPQQWKRVRIGEDRGTQRTGVEAALGGLFNDEYDLIHILQPGCSRPNLRRRDRWVKLLSTLDPCNHRFTIAREELLNSRFATGGPGRIVLGWRAGAGGSGQ